jgi:hypothetical protein
MLWIVREAMARREQFCPASRQTTLCNYPAAERGDFGVVRPRRFLGPECRARGAAQAARGRLRLEIDLNTDRAWVARALRPRVSPWDASSPKWTSRLSSRERALVVSGCLTPVIFALDHFVPSWIFEWLRTEGMDIPEPRREILLTLTLVNWCRAFSTFPERERTSRFRQSKRNRLGARLDRARLDGRSRSSTARSGALGRRRVLPSVIGGPIPISPVSPSLARRRSPVVCSSDVGGLAGGDSGSRA